MLDAVKCQMYKQRSLCEEIQIVPDLNKCEVAGALQKHTAVYTVCEQEYVFV